MDKRRIGVRGIIEKDGKILAVRQKRENGKEANFWAIPGGGLDPGESLELGVARELYEELGIQAAVGNLLFIQQFPSTRADCDEELEFFFHIKNSDDFQSIDLSATSHGLEEIARVEFIDPRREYVLPEFLQTVDVARHIVNHRPTIVKSYLAS